LLFSILVKYMWNSMFNLKKPYELSAWQDKALNKIMDGFESWEDVITLLGATGTGKTFTMANIIQRINKPVLVFSHNKTLAAQLSTEFKNFFPKNAVHYFVSYFDYYQPESYIPSRDTYIEKDSAVNSEIEMYRLSTMASLLDRNDTIVVSSVSCLYGLGKKQTFKESSISFEVWKTYDFDEIKQNLVALQYEPVQWKLEQGMFDFKGEIIDIFSSIDRVAYRLIFDENELELIQVKDGLTFEDMGTANKVNVRPATQFMQDMEWLDDILKQIKKDLDERVKYFKDKWKELEAKRIKKRTMHDIRMIRETGFTKWIENYSKYFEGRRTWEPPYTLFDYFPDDFLLIIDESHMSIPQIKSMSSGDASRKQNLIENGFRLPSAADHRPLRFEEVEQYFGWSDEKYDKKNLIQDHIKPDVKTLFVSATPSDYELENSDRIVEQIIRPTWLLDPKTYVYPKSGDYSMLMDSLDKLLEKKPYLNEYLKGYDQDVDYSDGFF